MTNFTLRNMDLYQLVDPSRASNKVAVEDVINPIKSILTELILDKSQLHEVAQRSYVHDLGFTKVVLILNPELRLHFWSGQPKREQANIHNHTADFGSYVLYGRLRHELFRQTRERSGTLPNTLTAYRCGSTLDNIYEMNMLSRGTLKRTHEEIIEGPKFYSLNYNILHRITPLYQTVTLLAQGPRKCNYTDVWSSSEWPSSIQVKALSTEALIQLFNNLLRELDNRYVKN